MRLHLLALLFMLIAASLVLGCGDDDDDDDDDNDSDNDGWSDDGCQYEQETQTKSGTGDCMPSLPDPDLEQPLEAMFEAYFGEYEDQDGDPVVVSCDPSGEWSLPHYWSGPDGPPCAYYYSIPVEIQIGQEPAVLGRIRNNAGLPTTDPLTVAADVIFEFGGTHYSGHRGESAGALVWEFASGDVWTKQ